MKLINKCSQVLFIDDIGVEVPLERDGYAIISEEQAYKSYHLLRLVDFGCVSIVTEEIPYFVGMGRIPVRQDIIVLPGDDPKGYSIGFPIKEKIGLCVINTYSLDRLSLSACQGIAENPDDNTKHPSFGGWRKNEAY